MTAPERRRPLPALAFIGALSLLTALVWFRVLHRTDTTTEGATKSSCPTSSSSASSSPPPAAPRVLPIPGKVSVLVLNSTQRKGLAGTASKALKKQGFKVAHPTDDASTYGGHGLIKGVAEIRYGAAALASATLLRYYFPAAALKPTDSSTTTVMVSLGAKFKAVAATAVVHRELTKAHVKLSRTATPAPTPSPTATRC
jgi:LytR cell envelope-related transcriptional attenuator